MISIGFVPWYNVPAREFPAQKWLRQRYPFTVSPASVARLGDTSAPEQAGQRRFPALVWLEAAPPSLPAQAPPTPTWEAFACSAADPGGAPSEYRARSRLG